MTLKRNKREIERSITEKKGDLSTEDNMKNRIVVPIDLLVKKYIEYGNEHGFFRAENILMKYLPDDNPDGTCANVPPEKRHDFLMELVK